MNSSEHTNICETPRPLQFSSCAVNRFLRKSGASDSLATHTPRYRDESGRGSVSWESRYSAGRAAARVHRLPCVPADTSSRSPTSHAASAASSTRPERTATLSAAGRGPSGTPRHAELVVRPPSASPVESRRDADLSNQVCAQLFMYTDNVALPAFARRCCSNSSISHAR